MSKLHYTIDSRQKALIEKKPHGKIDIVVKDVVRLEENRTLKLDHGNFINNIDNKKKNYTWDECITIFLYSLAIVLLVFLLALLAISRDFNILKSSYIDNVIGIVALLFSLTSIPKIKENLSRWLIGPKILAKAWYIIMILCLPIFIGLFISWLGLSNSISNICGFIGIVISIITW